MKTGGACAPEEGAGAGAAGGRVGGRHLEARTGGEKDGATEFS